MGKLIVVVGNSGVGKTTLATRLCEIGSFTPFLEETDGRPFLQRFHDDRKGFCFANQVDFMIYQAEKELFVRENEVVGVQDSGLDESYHVFTQRFHQKGYLDSDEFNACERLYKMFRQLLPLPDLMIYLSAPTKIIAKRMRKRGREIDIERSQDLFELENLIENWLKKNTSIPTIHIDASRDDPFYSMVIEDLLKSIKTMFGI